MFRLKTRLLPRTRMVSVCVMVFPDIEGNEECRGVVRAIKIYLKVTTENPLLSVHLDGLNLKSL